MEPQSSHVSTKLSIIIVILALGIGYVLLNNSNLASKRGDNNLTEASMMVTVENTVALDGKLSAPPGFPQDIPFEENEILESAVTHYPYEHFKQFTLDYRSTKTVEEKSKEYLNYLEISGYQLSDVAGRDASLLGTRENTSLRVEIVDDISGTIVQLSYTKPML